MKFAIAAALLSLACSAQAQMVYKCVGKGGALSYQSDPCESGVAAKAWAATPEPPPSAAQLRAREYARQRAQVESQELAARAGRWPGHSHGEAQGAAIPIGGNACAKARAERDEWLKSPQGRDAGIDGRRVWHEYVWNACK
ncbi:DUF4124 domain-containing protein [Lysobacter sp. K5869]|uniref:DUF4124 domain-containing protein n=1 Tax=Lysobacter sp. K5869 TaxID=2820808 RepID=UPI001C06456A|nr:DUF4124 domain-containing protein [Lysobacter sp. K5869]QWP75386.1 DUF4124 domain-containing protein [Lysobacter sp. K5869]